MLYLLLLSSTIGDNTIRSFMSTLPVAIYTDPLNKRETSLNRIKKKSGIYTWTIKSSGKTYVGSAINLPVALDIIYH